MTTTPAMPELPRETVIAIGKKHFPKTNLSNAWFGFAADIALATLQAQPAAPAMLTTSIDPRPLRYSLDDYHKAPSEGPLHFTWKDKPHRLLYDLIAAVAYYTRPVAQPAAAEVSDADDDFADKFDGWIETIKAAHDESLEDLHKSSRAMLRDLIDEMEAARAILALRPQAVPMTDEPTWIEWAPGDPHPTDSSRIEWVNSAGHTGSTTADKLCWHGDGLPVKRYRITAQPKGVQHG